jgi:hypothetical protein
MNRVRISFAWVLIIFGLLLIAYAYLGSAHARSRCTYYTDGREPRCLTTSDTGKEQYKDDRKKPTGTRPFSAQHQAIQRQTMMRQYMAKQRAAQERGRADWRNSGTPSSVGTISPFVPGSTQDTAWRAERKRRGIQ